MNPSIYKNPHPLKKDCRRWLGGRRPESIAAHYRRMADYAEQNKSQRDAYGDGGVVEELENYLSKLFGHQKALFFPTGAMAQQVACRLWCDKNKRPVIAMHPTCQMETNEHKAYEILHGLSPRLLGDKGRQVTEDDIAELSDAGVFVFEAPMRALGGTALPLDDLKSLVASVKRQGVRAHLDGARLFEITPFYGGDHTAIAPLFDSVYVSLYKGVGAFAGAALLGDKDFIEEVSIWRRRHGGEMRHMHSMAISTMMNLAETLEKSPHWTARAKDVFAIVEQTPLLRATPSPPTCNMMHIEFQMPLSAATYARDKIAKEDEVWLFDFFLETAEPGWLRTELVLFDAVEKFSNEEIERFLKTFVEYAIRSYR